MIRFHEACGKTGKAVAARLLPDTDLIEGIEAVCEKNNIQYKNYFYHSKIVQEKKNKK